MSAVLRLALLALALLVGPAEAQVPGSGTPLHYLSAGNANATNVKASPGTIFCVFATNNSATAYYLHLFDKATAPTAGTDTPVSTIEILGDGAPHGVCPTPGMAFKLGIGFTYTSGIGDTDSGSAATGTVITFVIQ